MRFRNFNNGKKRKQINFEIFINNEKKIIPRFEEFKELIFIKFFDKNLLN